MFKRSKMKFGKFNKKEIIDAAIGALIVENAPTVLNMLLPATYSTGLTGDALSGALGYVVGTVLKKPTTANVSIAVAVAKIVNSQLVAPVLNSVVPTATASAPGAALKGNTRRYLSEYTAAPRASDNYAFAYN